VADVQFCFLYSVGHIAIDLWQMFQYDLYFIYFTTGVHGIW
jgi:hypothetical protein